MTSPILSFLPPKNLWPKRIYELPEYKNYPEKLNFAEEFIDKNFFGGNSSKAAILFNNRTVTYSDLFDKTNKLAAGLRKLGILKDDRVIIRSHNTPEAVIANFAIIKLGAISVPTSPLFSASELIYVANDCEAKAIICSQNLFKEIEEAENFLKSVKFILVIGAVSQKTNKLPTYSFEEIISSQSGDFESVKKQRQDVSILLYTSGTTGRPKGTAHFMEEPLLVSDGFGKYCWKVKENDVIGGVASIAFGAGYATFCAIPYRFGATASLLEKFSPQNMLETIEKHKISILTLAPTAYRKILEADISLSKYNLNSLKLLSGGGESLTEKTFLKWKEKYGHEILESMGTTEMFFVFVSNTAAEKPKPGSFGKIVPGYVSKIVDENMKEVQDGETGMLLVQGPTGALYWKNNEKQKEAVFDGWNKVGDFVQQDEDGYFWFIAREDDLIKSSGYRIGPEEIETAILNHLAVKDVAVVGAPDQLRGQIVKAFIVLHEGFEPSEKLKTEILDFLKGKIAVYKMPRDIEFIDSLPRLPSGKLLRRKLKSQKDV